VPQWLWFSILASVILTVVLNVALRRFPGAGPRPREEPDRRSRVRMIVPWRLMLAGSLLLTLVLNLALWLSR
jgi:hypothetical protein